MDWERNTKTGEVTMRRRYLRHDGKNPQLAVFEWGKSGWSGTTLFPPMNADPRRRDAYVDNQRHGALLYRRPKGE